MKRRDFDWRLLPPDDMDELLTPNAAVQATDTPPGVAGRSGSAGYTADHKTEK